MFVPVFVPDSPSGEGRRCKSARRLFSQGLLCIAVLTAALVFAVRARAATFTPTRFTVVDAGTAGKPNVILIPGLNSSRAVWDAEARLLAPNYRLHLLQINGFAGQPAGPNASGAILPPIVDELHSYIVAANIHPDVMGHSLGGLLALMLASKYPADARKLILVDTLPAAAQMISPGATPATVQPQIEALRQQMTALPADQYAAMEAMMATRLVKNADAQKLVAASAASSDRTVATNAMMEDLLTDVTPDLAKIQTPTLLLYPVDAAMQKPEATDALYRNAYKTMPHVTLKRVDDSRHFIMYDEPATFYQLTEAFLR